MLCLGINLMTGTGTVFSPHLGPDAWFAWDFVLPLARYIWTSRNITYNNINPQEYEPCPPSRKRKKK
jgi:hypothetical protein